LRQVLLNLLSNAVKFTEHGSIVLKVSVERLTDKNVNLLFKIKDTGIGIPKDKLQGLFREFTQVDSSHTRKFGGTGLGLAIVKKLVKMLNGKISVESEVGVGSVFTFSIRAKLASKMPAKPEDQAEEEAQQDYIGEDYPMRVLMAEDNSVNRKLTTLFLERMGYVPEVVSDGLDVIKKLKTKTFDVILLDIAMPQMDGYEVLKLVRQMDLEKQPRIIGVSANAFKGDIEKGMSLGLDDYLVKPLRFNELKEKLIASYKTIHNSKP
jgi:CheY-like chemotaxis protein